jgi:C-methyltransferase C-terminal domain/Putative zinc binding domain/Methyltransferase domain
LYLVHPYMTCRFCNHTLEHTFIDLGHSPPSNAYLKLAALNEPETHFPLKVWVCDRCFLVQIEEYQKSANIFNAEYAYFSSYSSSWLAHSKRYTEGVVQRFGFNAQSFVVEIASNDGYLLQYFKEKNIPVLGIEPTANTAQVAIDKGIHTTIAFFGEKFAQQLVAQGKSADLLLGNNVLAHVPDINDFVKGLKILLKNPTQSSKGTTKNAKNTEGGGITMEFPHLLNLIQQNQFDTVYHEHFSYLSLHTVKQIFEKQGLALFDVETLPTHGGSLRIYAKHKEDFSKKITANVANLLKKEVKARLHDIQTYQTFQAKANKVKDDFLQFLLKSKKLGKTVVGYGAAAKGNTLLNYCGIKSDILPFVVDASPHKQGKYLPASHIPVVEEAKLKAAKPDFVVIFPWNIKEEVMAQLTYIRDWGGKFVVAVPKLDIC